MKLVVEYDLPLAGSFAVGAGHPDPGAVRMLMDGNSAALRVESGDGLCGYFWFCWVSRTVMALYACVPNRRGLWTRQVLGDLHKFPELLGARRLIAKPPNDGIADLLRRIAWEASRWDGDGCQSISLPNKWSARYGRDLSIHS